VVGGAGLRPFGFAQGRLRLGQPRRLSPHGACLYERKSEGLSLVATQADSRSLDFARVLRFANDLASLGMTIRCKGVGGGQVLGDRAEAGSSSPCFIAALKRCATQKRFTRCWKRRSSTVFQASVFIWICQRGAAVWSGAPGFAPSASLRAGSGLDSRGGCLHMILCCAAGKNLSIGRNYAIEGMWWQGKEKYWY
jgi:hypothetical protein